MQLPDRGQGTRYVHVHRNVPGMLERVNLVFSGRGLNIAGEFLQTQGDVGYVVVDADTTVDDPGVLADLDTPEDYRRWSKLPERN